MAKGKGKLTLITYREEAGVEGTIGALARHHREVMEKAGTGGDQRIGDILVVFRNLYGALYNPSVIDRDFWDKTETPTGPGRVSVLYYPMFMEIEAFHEYVSSCTSGNHLPLVLADAAVVKERCEKSGTSTVERHFLDLREALGEVASAHDLAFLEVKIGDIIKGM
ncbi:MAG: hypothetical protein RDV48_30270 [Candidatus Eremiobacteraeota bacterium]|nr:hypothetical protein [Candidatus Eremiobacteraeota bacterium]